MRIYKRPNAKKYSIDFSDHIGIAHRLAGYTDKSATHELARNLKRLIQCREHRERPDQQVMLVMKTWPQRIRKALLKWDIIDAHRDAETKTLSTHLADFEQALLAKGSTAKHARQVKGRAERLADGCKFVRWSDIQPSRVQNWLHEQRQDITDAKGKLVKRGISAQTSNFYLQNFKQFCTWMVRDGRAAENPVQHLQGVNVRTDRRHDRRALTVDELRKLLQAALSGPERYGMTGAERMLCYRLTLETGLRAGEIRSLTRASFDLASDGPTVTIEAAYSKRRRRDQQPLRPDTAAMLAQHLQHKAPAAKAFNLPEDAAEMLRKDLQAAGIAYRDDTGRVADFHALRHTFITNLASSGVSPKVAQSLARHSTITLTMDRYTHTLQEQETAAVAMLPDLTAAEPQQATGTAGADLVRPFVQHSGEFPRTTTDFDRPASASRPKSQNEENPVKHGISCDSAATDHQENAMPAAGFEPATCGLEDRCSIQLSYAGGLAGRVA